MSEAPLTKGAAMDRLLVASLSHCMADVAHQLCDASDESTVHAEATLLTMLANVSSLKTVRAGDKVEAMMALVNGEPAEKTAASGEHGMSSEALEVALRRADDVEAELRRAENAEADAELLKAALAAAVERADDAEVALASKNTQWCSSVATVANLHYALATVRAQIVKAEAALAAENAKRVDAEEHITSLNNALARCNGQRDKARNEVRHLLKVARDSNELLGID